MQQVNLSDYKKLKQADRIEYLLRKGAIDRRMPQSIGSNKFLLTTALVICTSFTFMIFFKTFGITAVEPYLAVIHLTKILLLCAAVVFIVELVSFMATNHKLSKELACLNNEYFQTQPKKR